MERPEPGPPGRTGALRGPGRLASGWCSRLVLLIRLPFLNQAIQGDDPTYLTAAAHALDRSAASRQHDDRFSRPRVDLRGHPHPPLNAWVLAGLIAVVGDVKEVPFHAAYIVFSLIAVWAMWSLARRFSPQPLWATLLFLAVPAFVVNGNSLETDLPFAGVLDGRHGAVLRGIDFWPACRSPWPRSLASGHFPHADPGRIRLALTPPRSHAPGSRRWFPGRHCRAGSSSEALHGRHAGAVLAGYFAGFDFWNPTGDAWRCSCTLVPGVPALGCPARFVLAWRKRREPDTLFLLAWIALFFAAGLVVFALGSARYLLPMAAPVALLASRLRPKWLAVGIRRATGAGPGAGGGELPALGRLSRASRPSCGSRLQTTACGSTPNGACATT